MAVDVDVTVTGLEDLMRRVDTLPMTVTERLQAVAAATAARVRTSARRILRSKTHGTGKTAEAIGIVEDLPRKQYSVISQAPAGKPSNLPHWIEYGTAHQEARPYMRPALFEEDDRYRRDMGTEAEAALREALG